MMDARVARGPGGGPRCCCHGGGGTGTGTGVKGADGTDVLAERRAQC